MQIIRTSFHTSLFAHSFNRKACFSYTLLSIELWIKMQRLQKLKILHAQTHAHQFIKVEMNFEKTILTRSFFIRKNSFSKNLGELPEEFLFYFLRFCIFLFFGFFFLKIIYVLTANK